MVDRPILIGRNVTLRAPCEADVDARFQFGHDAGIAEMFGAGDDDISLSIRRRS